MDKVLIIQLARTGDFLQTTPLFRKVKTAFPRCEVHVVIDTALQELVGSCSDIDRWYDLDMKLITQIIQDNTDIEYVFKYLDKQLAGLHSISFDAVYNLNYTPLSAAVASISKSSRIYGYKLGKDSIRLIRSPWFAFFNAMVQHLPLAPFNLVDVFYHLAPPYMPASKKLLYCASSQSANHAATLLAPLHNRAPKKIALQLATREPKRTWPVALFAETAFHILERHDNAIILTGTASESFYTEQFKRIASLWPQEKQARILDFTGKTTLPELASILSNCCVLVTGDTGTMHLGAAVGTKIVGIFLGPACAGFTGPYGEGHIVFQATPSCWPCLEQDKCPYNIMCASYIDPKAVAQAVCNMIDNRPVSTITEDNVLVLHGRGDEFGIMYEPLGETEYVLKNRLYRIMGASLLNRGTGKGYISQETNILPCRIEQYELLLQQINAMINTAHTFAPAVLQYRFYDDFSIWHPWIDFFNIMLRYCTPLPDGERDAVSAFCAGLTAAARMLRYYVLDNVQESCYVH
ncbi:MAG: glycosyltransferase family 9 protein [Desulfobacterota bacterium]|nr:glycosyltransferase family 9 protein [Thermodesulfobacteriota bacterium]